MNYRVSPKHQSSLWAEVAELPKNGSSEELVLDRGQAVETSGMSKPRGCMDPPKPGAERRKAGRVGGGGCSLASCLRGAVQFHCPCACCSLLVV